MAERSKKSNEQNPGPEEDVRESGIGAVSDDIDEDNPVDSDAAADDEEEDEDDDVL